MTAHAIEDPPAREEGPDGSGPATGHPTRRPTHRAIVPGAPTEPVAVLGASVPTGSDEKQGRAPIAMGATGALAGSAAPSAPSERLAPTAERAPNGRIVPDVCSR